MLPEAGRNVDRSVLKALISNSFGIPGASAGQSPSLASETGPANPQEFFGQRPHQNVSSVTT